MRTAGRRWRGPQRLPAGTPSSSLLAPLVLWLLALMFVSLSPLVGSSRADVTQSFVRDPFVNLVLTGVEEETAKGNSPDTGADGLVNMAANASLAQTPQTEKRNVVLIHLESTRAQSITPYNEDLDTTPFLNELAKSSLLVEQSYVVVPGSSRATLTVNCGTPPPLYQDNIEFYKGREFASGGVPAPCLAHLLKEQGYSSVFFQSSSENMDDFGTIADNLGYEEHYPSESMDTAGFERVNYISYEDDIMLEPSEEWLEKHKDEPFIAEYLTGAGHEEYKCLNTSYGSEDFAEDELLNSYLNCMRLQDHFLKNLFDQYKQISLYEDTIFVIFGDHGEAFGEHGRFAHANVPYEEALKIPLIIHAPGWFEDGERVEGLSNQTDILPTVVEILGYEVEGGEYPGYPLLRKSPEDRILMFSCFNNRKCLASIKGSEKYIYHYGNQPEEVFDLSKDPLEQNNIADEYSQEELDRRREDLLAWQARVNAEYGR
jgi:phosphoglycerol transferase MdoB-like AlkP superfamily enzyme